MMVELGKYAGAVLSAYGVTIVLVLAIVWQSIRRNAAARRELEAEEARRHAR